MNKNDLRVIKTKKGIHEALLRLLNKKPLTQIKVTELCKEATINRGTFYFHYEEVGDVFSEFFEEIIQDLKASYDEPYKVLGKDNFSVHRLDPNMVRIFHHIKKYEGFYKIVFSNNVSSNYYYMLFDEIRANLTSDENNHHQITTNKFYYSYQANAIIGMIIEWYRNGFQESAEEMNVYLMEIVKFKVLDEKLKKESSD